MLWDGPTLWRISRNCDNRKLFALSEMDRQPNIKIEENDIVFGWIRIIKMIGLMKIDSVDGTCCFAYVYCDVNSNLRILCGKSWCYSIYIEHGQSFNGRLYDFHLRLPCIIRILLIFTLLHFGYAEMFWLKPIANRNNYFSYIARA